MVLDLMLIFALLSELALRVRLQSPHSKGTKSQNPHGRGLASTGECFLLPRKLSKMSKIELRGARQNPRWAQRIRCDISILSS
jgi:hypothetical protein